MTFERNLASALLGFTGANEFLSGGRLGQTEGVHMREGLASLEQGDAAEILLAAENAAAGEPSRAGDWSAIEALIGSVPGPEDSAREHDHYLYGSPKRAKVE